MLENQPTKINVVTGKDTMNRLKKIVAVMMLVSLLSTTSSAFAADDTLREVFTDAIYGAAIGGLVGAAFTVFQTKPLDHLNYVGYGAAAGVLVGTALGLAKSARAFAEVENGRVKIALPTIVPELLVSPASGQTTVAWKAELLRGTF
jgi:integral membrane sensor domain MASE1